MDKNKLVIKKPLKIRFHVGLRKILKMRLGLCLCLLMICAGAQAKGIDAVVSHTLFFLEEKGNMKAYIETYWEVNPKSLYLAKANNKYSAKIKTDIVFMNESGVVNEDHFILQTQATDSAKDSYAQTILELHRYILPYGKIKMQVTLSDIVDSNNRFSYTDSFSVEKHETAFCSGIEFLDTVYSSAQTGSMFIKNDLLQIPLCSNFLDENRNSLRYYFEWYRTDSIPAEQYPVTQEVYLSRKPGDLPFPKHLKKDTIRSGKDIIPVLGKFDISELPSGNYFISAELKGAQNNKIAGASLFFQRLNTREILADTAAITKTDSALEHITVLDLRKTFVAKYSLAQVRTILRMLLPVSDASEVQTINGFLKSPQEMYMRYYIYNHFSNINRGEPDKAWKDFSDMVREVNKEFGSASTSGYETDRGIVYMKYGKPTERINVENESGAYPYEVWQYDALKLPNKTLSNAVFLFYRPSDMIIGFRLLHSNVPGEIINKNWRSYLYLNGRPSGNNNARAEQYIGNR